MNIKPVRQNNSYNPIFQASAINKVKYAKGYLSCAFQKNYPPPEIYRQLLPFRPEKAPFKTFLLKSEKPMEDLKEIYKLYKQDFSCYYHYLSLKKFKNDMYQDNAAAFVLKSGEETYGFYSVSIRNDDTLYVDAVDLNPKYRNTKLGKGIILTCWENINQIAKNNQCSRIGLHVDADKKHLVNLYKKFGFKIIEDRTRKNSMGQTALYMEKTADNS